MDLLNRKSAGITLSLLVIFFFIADRPAARAVEQGSPFAAHGRPDAGDLVRLKQIERVVLPPRLEVGPRDHDEIVDYYCEANAALRDRLAEAKDVFASRKRLPFRAMTVVAGSAGVGKTFIKRRVYSDVPRSDVWKFDIRELFDELAQQGFAEATPDLRHGDRVFNRLIRLTPAGRQEFARMLTSNSAAFVVADSLDEIHPDDYRFVLEQLEQISINSSREFVHLVVFGRPLSFRDYWLHRQDASDEVARDDRAANAGVAENGNGEPRSFLLNKPRLRTTGDLMVSNWNYDCWKHRLHLVSDGETRPMPLKDYQRWCADSFCSSADYTDVTYEANPHMTREAHDLLERLATSEEVVASVLSNLAGNEIARDILVEQMRRGEDFDDYRFRSEFLSRWLERDTRSDGRPSRLQPENLDLYLRLLEAIAARFADENRLDDLGYFEVSPDERVSVRHEGQSMSVPVLDVLDRSGLVTADVATHAQRYRFEPFWFHRHLVQMHQERRDQRVAISRLTTQVKDD